MNLRVVVIITVLFCCFMVYFYFFSLSQVGLSDAVDLFRARRVFIKDGFAFVPLKDIDAIVFNNYRKNLSKALAVRVQASFY